MIDVYMRYEGSLERLREALEDFLYQEKQEPLEFVLRYKDKWIWIFTYHEDDCEDIKLDVNFSHKFSSDEIGSFILEMEKRSVFEQ